MSKINIEKLANSGALRTKKYIPGKSKQEVERELGLKDIIKLASNENPHGSSPFAGEALKGLVGKVNIYPDKVSTNLRRKLAELTGCTEEEITVGNGADGVIFNLGMAVIDQGDEVIIPEVTFPVYETITLIMRGKVVYSMVRDLRIDLPDILARITLKTKAIFLCNPNNPTGDALPPRELTAFLRQVPEEVLIVLDEAYIDFTEKSLNPGSIEIFKGGLNNLFIIRTLSKAYGLAGIRVGYGIGAIELVSLVNQVKPPFDVSLIAEVAGRAALADTAFLQATLTDSIEEKSYFYRELDKLKLKYITSHTNFVLIDTGFDANDIFERLLLRGVIVRSAKGYNLPTCIRVTLGRHEENVRFFEALGEALEETLEEGI